MRQVSLQPIIKWSINSPNILPQPHLHIPVLFFRKNWIPQSTNECHRYCCVTVIAFRCVVVACGQIRFFFKRSLFFLFNVRWKWFAACFDVKLGFNSWILSMTSSIPIPLLAWSFLTIISDKTVGRALVVTVDYRHYCRSSFSCLDPYEHTSVT